MTSTSRLPNSVHQSHPWVMTEIAPDFELLDAWVLPVEGEREDFDTFLRTGMSLDPARSPSAVSRMLFALRFRIGALLGWDDHTQQRPIPGCVETSLSARLPERLRGSAALDGVGSAYGFVPLYRTDNEWAAEISNATVHGVLQVGWVEQGNGRYRGELGVYVKPRGRLGRMYMKLIEPFRLLVVYPAMMRQIGRAWAGR